MSFADSNFREALARALRLRVTHFHRGLKLRTDDTWADYRKREREREREREIPWPLSKFQWYLPFPAKKRCNISGRVNLEPSPANIFKNLTGPEKICGAFLATKMLEHFWPWKNFWNCFLTNETAFLSRSTDLNHDLVNDWKCVCVKIWHTRMKTHWKRTIKKNHSDTSTNCKVCWDCAIVATKGEKFP